MNFCKFTLRGVYFAVLLKSIFKEKKNETLYKDMLQMFKKGKGLKFESQQDSLKKSSKILKKKLTSGWNRSLGDLDST